MSLHHLVSPILLPFSFLLLACLYASPTLGVGVALDAPPSMAGNCPVLNYRVDVSPAEAVQSQLRSDVIAVMQDPQLARAVQGSPAESRSYIVSFIPTSFVANTTLPSVDWVDLHFRINDRPQLNVQMKDGVGADSMAMMSEPGQPTLGRPLHAATSALPEPQHFVFGPVMLTDADTLTFSFTYCASMIDCTTEVHVFRPRAQAQPPSPEAIRQAPERAPEAPTPEEQLQQGCPTLPYKAHVDCGDDFCKVNG